MTPWADPVALHDRALDATAAVVAGVGAGHLGLPTPCREWDVGRLLAHLAESNEHFTVAANALPAELPDDDPLAAYALSTEAVRRAWHQPDLLERRVALPFGTFPAAVAVRMHTVDHLVHGWDVAVATGQDAALPDDLVAAAWEEMTAALDGAPRSPGHAFGPPVPWPDDAPLHQRLVAFLGRQPR